MSNMCASQSMFFILFKVLHFSKAYLINDNVSDIENSAQIRPINTPTFTQVNNSNIVANDNSNLMADDVRVEEEKFTETYFDLMGNFAPNYLSDRSLKNDSKRSSADENLSLVSDDLHAEEEKFTETYFDIMGSLAPNYLIDRSLKNDSKRYDSIDTLQPLNSLSPRPLGEENNLFKKREVKQDDKKKFKNPHKPTQRSVSTSTRGATLWEEWTPWSSCSVSCGKGRHIRWRHCRDNCNEAETEMEEKTCQMPACPQKLFGLINL